MIGGQVRSDLEYSRPGLTNVNYVLGSVITGDGGAEERSLVVWGDLYPGDSVGWRQECYIGYAELVTQHHHYTHYFSSLHTTLLQLTSTHHTNSDPEIIIFSISAIILRVKLVLIREFLSDS